jgi:hypothetical protein
MMSIYNQKFSSPQVAAAAGMAYVNFRAHLTRGHWKLAARALPAGENRKGHLFTVYDALGYALAYRLACMGAAPRLAFELGMLDCAYLGEEVIAPLLEDQGERAAWFVYYPWTPRREASQLLIGPRPQVSAFFENFAGEQAVIIDMFALRDQVFRVLDLEAEAA